MTNSFRVMPTGGGGLAAIEGSDVARLTTNTSGVSHG